MTFLNNDTAIYAHGGFSATGLVVVGNGGQYGIRALGGGGTQLSVFASCIVSGSFSVAGIAIDDTPAQHVEGALYTSFIGCSSANSGPGDAWLMPLNAPSVRLINCDCPAAEFTFTTLPNLSAGTAPVIGDEYLVSDSPTATSGHFATAVTVGASSNHVKVRWDGADWRIV